MADPLQYARPYLDAQAWISALSGTGPYAADLAEVLAAADRGDLRIVTSVLMPLEVLGGTHDDRTAASAERARQALQRSTVLRVAITSRVVDDARALRLRHRLRSVDALHLACAVSGQADAFLTNDDALVAVGEHGGVPITRPVWPGNMPLDFSGDDA